MGGLILNKLSVGENPALFIYVKYEKIISFLTEKIFYLKKKSYFCFIIKLKTGQPGHS